MILTPFTMLGVKRHRTGSSGWLHLSNLIRGFKTSSGTGGGKLPVPILCLPWRAEAVLAITKFHGVTRNLMITPAGLHILDVLHHKMLGRLRKTDEDLLISLFKRDYLFLRSY